MSQILFLRKNHIDLQRPNTVITVTDSVATNTGQNSIDQIRNRNNISGWLTTGSDDSANTELIINMGDILPVDFVELVLHNFADYTIDWLDANSNWVNLVTVTSNTLTTTIHELDAPIFTRQLRLTIQSTITPDQDKELRQLIITEKLYRFNGWPVVKPRLSRERKVNKMPSGRVNIARVRGSFSVEIEIKLTSDTEDLAFHQSLYERNEGVLILLTGGDEDQFNFSGQNYRNQDIALVSPINEYENPYRNGVYKLGIPIRIPFAEVDR